LAELAGAPKDVRGVLEDLPKERLELVFQNEETEMLAEEYIAQAVVPPRMRVDGQHIAMATVARVDVLVSWNFRHIVNLNRIRAFNAVNLRLGYPMLEIRSPLEVWIDADEDT
jgi:hypothetical protein